MTACVRLAGLAAWALLGLASCAGAGGASGDLSSSTGAPSTVPLTSAAVASSATSSAASPASSSATSAPTAESAPLPPALDWPKQSACELASPSWPLEGSVLAALSPNGEPAFELAGGWNARVALSEGLAEKAVITGEFSDAGITLRGHLKLEAVQLFASQPLLLGGVFIPDGTTPLRWREAKKGQPTVSAEAPEGVRFLQPAQSEVGCSGLSLSTSRFDRLQGASTQKVATLGMFTTPLVLFGAPEGKPAVKIDRSEQPHMVNRLDSLGAWARVAVAFPSGDVVGWVRSDSLSLSKGGVGGLGRASSRRGFGALPVLESRVCPEQLPVIMTVGPLSRVIGSLDAHTPFDLTAYGGALTGVQLRSKRLSPRGGQFFVRTSDLTQCKPAAPEAP